MKNLMKQIGLLFAIVLLLGMNSARAAESVVPSTGADPYGLDDLKGIQMSYRTVADLPHNEYVEVKVQNGLILLAAQEKSGKKKSKGRKISDEEIRKVAGYYQKIDFLSETEPASPEMTDSTAPTQEEKTHQLEYGYGDQSRQRTNPHFQQPEYAELLAWYEERIKEFLAQAYPNQTIQ